MNLLSVCRQIARRTFRIQSLRPEQESAMLAVLNGRDAFVSLPTGFGKSLIYQVPAMIVERPTIVISPLIALMTDQERALSKRGVPVVALHSRLRAAERRAALERLKKGGRLVVLTTPETLESAATAPLFERARPALLCIDEAHCISEWGHDFRPSYLRLGDARKRLGNPPVLALTATATPRVREDISERLRLDNPRVIVAPAHRENLGLTIDVVPGAAKFPAAARRIKRLQLSVVRCFAARDGRLWLGCCFSLGDLALVHQSSSLDGLCFGPFALKQDGLTTSEVDVGRCQVL